MTGADEYALDKARVREAFGRAAAGYEAHAVLQREVQGRLLERLDLVKLQPARVLDLGCGTGEALDLLRRRYRKAELTGVDFAPGMVAAVQRRGRWWRRPLAVCADIEALPLPEAHYDLAISSAALQWCSSLDQAFSEVRRVLAPGALWTFSTFGPDTLRELRAAFAEVDGGNAQHVNAFVDMHDIGDALVRAGFADPVMDQESLTLTYGDFDTLLRDLRGVGVRNALAGRGRGLLGPRRLQAVAEAYARAFAVEGRLPATWEIVYGHAWVPEAPPPSKPQGRVIPVRPVS
ncbi:MULTISPECIES: malonyl-ACP O-methyltransferase BioC [unclassified Thioalkalivibrio]|uniref:malonyl-ACP O-methyltransferase BioC n=1 Tax=unclassified Thioalkalivibrio TaxID=2621013 RepID=UPI0003809D43|nr:MULTISPECIES: malonyl-ACP O-methyltransferase BioC [unclassified Thioalkalivibrio]